MEPHDGPEWGYCQHPDGCTNVAFPLWFSGSFPDDPDLLWCDDHIGRELGRLQRERDAAQAAEAYWQQRHGEAWMRVGWISAALEKVRDSKTAAERLRWIRKALEKCDPGVPYRVPE